MTMKLVSYTPLEQFAGQLRSGMKLLSRSVPSGDGEAVATMPLIADKAN